MRPRPATARALLLAALLLFALAALLPLRLVLGWFDFGERGLAARAATGSVWGGVLADARFGPAVLGDVRARLHLLPLFVGRARLSLVGGGEEAPLRGSLTAAPGGFALDDVAGRFRLNGAGGLPIATVELDGFEAAFADGRCVRAAGHAQAAAAGALAALAPALTGEARCDGSALLLPLAGASGAERLDLRLFADGRYRLDLMARTADPALRGRLLAAGMRPAGAGLYRMRAEGAF